MSEEVFFQADITAPTPAVISQELVYNNLRLSGTSTFGTIGSAVFGDDLNDALTVNATTTFNSNVIGLTKAMVGLSNVNNTSDENKLTQVQNNANAFTNLNEFINYLPTSAIVPNSNFQLSNKKYVDDSIANLVGGSVASLNTLNELALALGNDANYSTTITTSLGTKAGLTSNNTLSGNNTFSGNDLFSGTNTFTGNLVANSVVITPSTLSKIQWLDISSSLTTLLATKQNTINSSTDLTCNSLNSISSTTLAYIDPTSSIQTQINSKLATSTAATTYQPVINGFSNITVNNLTTGGILSSNQICEKFNSLNATSTNVYTLNYSTGSVFFIASGQQPTANFTVDLTNVPTTSTNQYTFTLIYQGNFYPSLVSATDATPTTIVSSALPKYIGGSVPTLTSSALYICSLTVLQMYTTKYIIASVSTYN